MSQAGVPGYAGKFLRVDLCDRQLSETVFDSGLLRKWVGGSGLAARLLYDEVAPSVSWDHPENRLILASGPLAGSRVMGSGTFSAVCKGPVTNGATTTQANGFLGAYIKFCGYDGIIVQGVADALVYLYIHDDGVELREARHLAGKDTWETKELLATELGASERSISVFGIGPAGENLVKFAGIVGDRGHVAGHNGAGAVMGAKRLKAIAVARGRERVATADPPRVSILASQLVERIKTSPHTSHFYRWGTSMAFGPAAKAGWLPVRNYTTNLFPEHARFAGDILRRTFNATRHPCWACQTHHCHIMQIGDGPAAGFIGEEPEYEQWAACGPLIGNTDPAAALVISNTVDRLGLENNEAGWVVAWVMECCEKGLMTPDQLDGLDVRWGSVEASLELLRKIARREGIGDLLAEGVMRASRHIGGEAARCAVYAAKGNSPRGHDHRSNWHELLDTCTSSTGTIENCISALSFPDDYGLPPRGDRWDPDSVALRLAKSRGRTLFEDCLGVCRFCIAVELDFLVAIVNATTGWDMTREEALLAGTRVSNLLRVFNFLHGVGGNTDLPSERYGSVPVDGPTKGRGSREIWERMRSRYYDLAGWDRDSGKPLPQTLRALGLSAEADAMWEAPS